MKELDELLKLQKKMNRGWSSAELVIRLSVMLKPQKEIDSIKSMARKEKEREEIFEDAMDWPSEVDRLKKELKEKEEELNMIRNMARKEREREMNTKKRLLEVDQNLVDYIKRLKSTLTKQDRDCSDLRDSHHFYQDRDRKMNKTLKQNEEVIRRLNTTMTERNEEG